MRFDLHLHSFYSDGQYSPEEIIDLAIKRELAGISITDHDTTLAIDQAIEYRNSIAGDLKIIPGIEFSCVYKETDVHILGYFQNYKDSRMIKTIDFLRESRRQRGIEIINKLKELGLEIEYEDVLKTSNKDFIGRVPIAKALIKLGYTNTIEEGFERYLNRGRYGYVEKEGLNIEETIKLIKDIGGVSVLAHPGLLSNMEALDYSIDKGIDGIEYIHSKHSKKDEIRFKRIAKENNLIKTAGSDCHGRLVNDDILLGRYFIDLNSVDELKEMIV